MTDVMRGFTYTPHNILYVIRQVTSDVALFFYIVYFLSSDQLTGHDVHVSLASSLASAKQKMCVREDKHGTRPVDDEEEDDHKQA